MCVIFTWAYSRRWRDEVSIKIDWQTWHFWRAIVDGHGYFDVRDKNDKWIRIEVEKGDLLVIPGGSYHRFVPTLDDYIKTIRLFIGQPVWTPINRDTDAEKIDASPVRQSYLQLIK